MVCFRTHVLVINILFTTCRFCNCGKAILCRYCCHENSVTMATDSDQFYSLVLSTTETKNGVRTLVGQNIISQT